MNQYTAVSVEHVWDVLVDTLSIEDRPKELTAATPLLGAQPELDSMGVLALLFALEETFGITVEGDEVSVEIFETLGTLTEFVESKLS